MTASLNEKLQCVEWGEYRLGGEDGLFDVKTVKSYDEGKLELFSIKKENLIEFVGRTRTDNGIKGYVEKLDTEPNSEDVISVSQIGTIVAQLRKEKWYASQNMFILNPKGLYIKLISLFGVSIINKSLGEVFSEGYSNYPTLGKLEDLVVKLPTKTGKIDFEFMEDFVSELEQAKMRELEAYLQATGIQDYTLTSEEQKVLADFESERFEWRGFSIGELFEIKTSKKRFDANKIEIQDNGYPYIVRTALNNGIRGYIVEDQEFLNEGNTISFWQDTATMFYQDKPYFTGDKIKIVTSKVSNFRKQNAQFFITVMMKAFSLFSWGRSSFNVKIIENQVISLPKKNNNPDYEMMEIFISAIQKLVVRDMVEYVERKMGTVKEFN